MNKLDCKGKTGIMVFNTGVLAPGLDMDPNEAMSIFHRYGGKTGQLCKIESGVVVLVRENCEVDDIPTGTEESHFLYA